MAQASAERGLRFDVDQSFVLPSVAGVLAAGGRVETRMERFRSVYFDTADRALLDAGMTLRRRLGAGDRAWQLKVPHTPFRQIIRVDFPGDGVPDELRRLLLGVSRGQPLEPIASLVTQRSATRLRDAAGRHVADIDDDKIHASGAGDTAIAVTWREVDIALGVDEVRLQAALRKRLRRAGARPTADVSKLDRALNPASSGPPRGKLRASDVVLAYLAEQQRVMLAGDVALRRGDDRVVHATRVATRRVRSTLRVFSSLFDEPRAAALDDELRWYAAVLGEVRDREVLKRRLDLTVADVADELLLGPVKERIDTELAQEHAAHWQELVTQISSDRYLALLTEIARWLREPPLTSDAERPASRLTKQLRQANRLVARRLRRANRTGDVELLHAARKAAKRARYAAEAVKPVIGAAASAKSARRYQKLQDVLGEHQDSLVCAELLLRLGAKAGTIDGENGFAFGILYEREEHNARAARNKARRVAARY